MSEKSEYASTGNCGRDIHECLEAGGPFEIDDLCNSCWVMSYTTDRPEEDDSNV